MVQCLASGIVSSTGMSSKGSCKQFGGTSFGFDSAARAGGGGSSINSLSVSGGDGGGSTSSVGTGTSKIRSNVNIHEKN